MKKVYISCGVFSIVVFLLSLGLPSLVAKIDEYSLLGNHKMETINFKLDSEAKDIALVHKIHTIDKMMNLMNETSITSNIYMVAKEHEKGSIIEVLSQLIENEILVKRNDEDIVKMLESAIIGILTSNIMTGIAEYEIKIVDQQINLLVDLETGKILSIRLLGNQIMSLNPNHEILINSYLSYLNLDLLDDWVQYDKEWVSDKAALSLSSDYANEEIQYLVIKPKSEPKN